MLFKVWKSKNYLVFSFCEKSFYFDKDSFGNCYCNYTMKVSRRALNFDFGKIWPWKIAHNDQYQISKSQKLVLARFLNFRIVHVLHSRSNTPDLIVFTIHWLGSDLKRGCQNAIKRLLRRKVKAKNNPNNNLNLDRLSMEDLMESLKETQPMTNAKLLKKYEQWVHLHYRQGFQWCPW